MPDIQKDFEAWLDQDWPLWRQATDTGLIHKLRRTYEAAYHLGRDDQRNYEADLGGITGHTA